MGQDAASMWHHCRNTNVVGHTSDKMTKGLWIWKNRLTEALTTISDKADIDLTPSTFDEIKYGLIGTSNEKDNWLDYKIGDANLRLAVDSDDSDIVHIQIDGLDDKTIDGLSNLWTTE